MVDEAAGEIIESHRHGIVGVAGKIACLSAIEQSYSSEARNDQRDIQLNRGRRRCGLCCCARCLWGHSSIGRGGLNRARRSPGRTCTCGDDHGYVERELPHDLKYVICLSIVPDGRASPVRRRRGSAEPPPPTRSRSACRCAAISGIRLSTAGISALLCEPS